MIVWGRELGRIHSNCKKRHQFSPPCEQNFVHFLHALLTVEPPKVWFLSTDCSTKEFLTSWIELNSSLFANKASIFYSRRATFWSCPPCSSNCRILEGVFSLCRQSPWTDAFSTCSTRIKLSNEGKCIFQHGGGVPFNWVSRVDGFKRFQNLENIQKI